VADLLFEEEAVAVVVGAAAAAASAIVVAAVEVEVEVDPFVSLGICGSREASASVLPISLLISLAHLCRRIDTNERMYESFSPPYF
jgi:hypothetical protein